VTGHMSCDVWVQVAPKQVARLSRTNAVGVTRAFKPPRNPFFLLSSHFPSSLSQLSAAVAPFTAARRLRPGTIRPETRSFSFPNVDPPLNCVDLVFITSIILYRV
jgi:hypothetical protein